MLRRCWERRRTQNICRYARGRPKVGKVRPLLPAVVERSACSGCPLSPSSLAWAPQLSVAGSGSGPALGPALGAAGERARSLPSVTSFAAAELSIPRPLSIPAWGRRIGQSTVSCYPLTRSCLKFGRCITCSAFLSSAISTLRLVRYFVKKGPEHDLSYLTTYPNPRDRYLAALRGKKQCPWSPPAPTVDPSPRMCCARSRCAPAFSDPAQTVSDRLRSQLRCCAATR